MYEYDEECLKTFLKKQGQLFDEPVAETLEEAEAFLEDCMAAVQGSINAEKGFQENGGGEEEGMIREEQAARGGAPALLWLWASLLW